MIRRAYIGPDKGFNADLPLGEDVDSRARAMPSFGAVRLDWVSIAYRFGPSLMRQPNKTELIDKSYVDIHSRYRSDHNAVDFFALKIFAHLMEILPC